MSRLEFADNMPLDLTCKCLSAAAAEFRVVNRYVGNLAPMPGVFPDYPAPVIRNSGGELEMTMMRWGMPCSAMGSRSADLTDIVAGQLSLYPSLA